MGCLLPMLTFVQFIVCLGFRRFDNFFVARMGSYLACYRLDVLDVRFHVPVCNVSAFSRDFKKQHARERSMIFHSFQCESQVNNSELKLPTVMLFFYCENCENSFYTQIKPLKYFSGS